MPITLLKYRNHRQGKALFSDSFASGDRSHTEGGFTWSQANYTQTHVVPDANGADGSLYSMEFAWDGIQNAQMDFDWTQKHIELWFRELVYFEPNFSIGTGFDNNKILKSFGGIYGSATVDTSMGFEFRAQNAGEYAGAYPVFGHRWSGGVGPWGAGYSNDVFYRQDREPGTEVEYLYHVKVDEIPSDGTAWFTGGNGALEIWKNGILCLSFTGIKCYPQEGVAIGMDAGYIWGAWNEPPGYPSTLRVRKFEIFTSDPRI